MKPSKKQSDEQGGYDGRLFDAQLLCAIWIGKLLIYITRIFGRGGTTLPGRLSLKIAPGLSSSLTSQLTKGSVVVTGTNGKTTTASLINSILKHAGFKCIHNQSGSNLTWGVASALIAAASVKGQLEADYGIIEVDEGAFPHIIKAVQPSGIVTTNIFRDQLDRYGEIDSIREAIKNGLASQQPEGFQVINADEPSLTALVNKNRPGLWTYGLELELPVGPFENTGRDIKNCPLCGATLHYDHIFYAHLGHYRCLQCSYCRPKPLVKLVGYQPNGNGAALLRIEYRSEIIELNCPLPGIYNLYNILAAVSCALALKIDPKTVAAAVSEASPSFGRMEIFVHQGRTIVMALIKNPVGANEVLRTMFNHNGRLNLLVAINDKIADGRDVSWLWDVDFEQLEAVEDKLITITVSGLRAWDMAVRIKYAGLKVHQPEVEEDTVRAIEIGLERTKPGETLFILPTYTAMLEMRKALNRMGLGEPYWEEKL